MSPWFYSFSRPEGFKFLLVGKNRGGSGVKRRNSLRNGGKKIIFLFLAMLARTSERCVLFELQDLAEKGKKSCLLCDLEKNVTLLLSFSWNPKKETMPLLKGNTKINIGCVVRSRTN
ncbi:hypothetical protein CDAR_33911 [Caerostris darwini]|uniref:Uncharacterized protein n=1 Tax=Caerostris darwini TaxID=1538125 RepID=A0AAV4UYL9_9ARAC|nr:hypothetical protein CDAR_33911 [Caerostris darwini]